MIKKTFFLLILISISSSVSAKHLFPEKDYQKYWCNLNNGQTEVVLDDNTRVDCVTDNFAIEFDFAKKWAESIGQSLYYSIKVNKQPGVVLIIEDQEKEQIYIDRLMTVAKQFNISIWTTTQEDLIKNNLSYINLKK